jgi:hypothetical protein
VTADIAFTFERNGRQTITEREFRALEGRPRNQQRLRSEALEDIARIGLKVSPEHDSMGNERLFAVPTTAGVHYPDLVVTTKAGGMVAVETELTPKQPHQIKRVLRGFNHSRLYEQVIYFVTPPVANLMYGQRNWTTGEWEDGVLQELHLLPTGEPKFTKESPVRVHLYEPDDPGAAWWLDLAQIPADWHIGRGEWDRLRAEWETDEAMGKAAGVPFLRWWADHARWKL